MLAREALAHIGEGGENPRQAIIRAVEVVQRPPHSRLLPARRADIRTPRGEHNPKVPLNSGGWSALGC